MALAFDPADPAFRHDPYPMLRRFREEDPVHWSPGLKSWILTRYDDVAFAHHGAPMSSDRLTPFYKKLPPERRAPLEELIRYLTLWVVFRDPPEHTRMRLLMNQAVTPQVIQALTPRVEAIVDYALGRLDAGAEVDFVRDFALRVPGYVILDMLGIAREELDTLKAWSDEMALFIMSARATPDKYDRARAGAHAMAAYFRKEVEERRAAPRDDLLTRLVNARDAEDRLSDDELIATCMLFLFAGHETTTNLLANGLWSFWRHPEARQRLRADPALADSAVEECLRFDGPSTSSARVVAESHELGGKTLREGDRVFAVIMSANRDEAVFDAPDAFDVARSPNRHLTFGKGTHFCLGAPLARLEARIAFRQFLERYPDFEVLTEAPEWLDTMISRGITCLPVRLRP